MCVCVWLSPLSPSAQKKKLEAVPSSSSPQYQELGRKQATFSLSHTHTALGLTLCVRAAFVCWSWPRELDSLSPCVCAHPPFLAPEEEREERTGKVSTGLFSGKGMTAWDIIISRGRFTHMRGSGLV